MDQVQSLNGNNILFFSQFFFGYEKKITEKMVELGAEVSLYDEMSVTSMLDRALLKVSPLLFKGRTERYYAEILEKEAGRKYDYVLFIDCEMPTPGVLKRYREQFPEAKFCLHMWDSLENLKGVKDKLGYFDHVSTFDRKDAEACGLAFRPLFFCDEYRAKADRNAYRYDLVFIGTIHSDRYAIIRKLKESCGRFYCYPYLQSKFIYYFYKLTKKEFRNTKPADFRFDKIDSGRIAETVDASRAVLDIQHPRQSGLTIRTLEMLGMEKKLVTTNEDICNYDFYNENNICVIDRENPVVPDAFFTMRYEEIPEAVYEYYSIREWIMGVLGV